MDMNKNQIEWVILLFGVILGVVSGVLISFLSKAFL